MTRVAVIGAGYFGRFHYDAWARMDDAELVAACSLQGADEIAAAYGIAAYAEVEEMLRECCPDLIDITTPPNTHVELIGRVAPVVKQIICQKPFCGDHAGALDGIAAAEAHGARVIVHENFRFQPWYREIKTMLDAGVLGEIYQVTFRLRPGDGQGPDAYLARQPYFQKMPRFLVHETAIHWIDTFRYLLGEVSEAFADLRRLNPVIAGEDAGTILFRFANGSRGIFDGNRLSDHTAENRRLTMGEMEIEGSAATLRLDGDGAIRLRGHGSNDWQPHAYAWSDRNFGGDCVYLTNRAALEAFRTGDPAETEAQAYLRNIEIEDAVYTSNASSSWVAV
ncbi:MAG: Gfo/Idh/MocA family oxidoreductase [Pseudomonadota bacterium]